MTTQELASGALWWRAVMEGAMGGRETIYGDAGPAKSLGLTNEMPGTLAADCGTAVIVPPTAELRPPPERAWEPWHWLRHDGYDGPLVAEWSGDLWWRTANEDGCCPADMAAEGYCYIGPAEPPKGMVCSPDARLRGQMTELYALTAVAMQDSGRLIERSLSLSFEIARLTGWLRALEYRSPESVIAALRGDPAPEMGR